MSACGHVVHRVLQSWNAVDTPNSLSLLPLSLASARLSRSSPVARSSKLARVRGLAPLSFSPISGLERRAIQLGRG